ncbi:spore germination protein [Paenibacillus phyllosphaerae]|nr:spore germination protein [Paenibacillus phyllosphaerae]
MFYRSGRRNSRHRYQQGKHKRQQNNDREAIPLVSSINANLDRIAGILKAPEDLVVRSFKIGVNRHACAIICIDGLVDKALIQNQVIDPLLHHFTEQQVDSANKIATLVVDEVLTSFDIGENETYEDSIGSLLSGDSVLLIEGLATAIIIGSSGWNSRSVEEPQTESIIRGPREGFVEDIRTNTSLIRRRLREPNLRLITYKLGERARRTVVMMYIEGIVHPDLVEEAKRRIESIEIDDVEGSGTIEQWMSDSFLSPFPLIANTERPDKVTGGLLQGRIGILVDGDPFALVLPITFSSNLQSPEDYYQNWLIATLTRIMRLGAAFLATFLPALYISLLEFHHGMIPSKLAFSIAGAREGVPFPAVVEAFIMEITLELLREAGIRLPKPIGQTIGIVGGLVIGEAAVSAGIVSPVMVIVVAVTAISSFSFPSYSFAISLRMVRFAIMIAAAFFGLYGIILSYIMINIHFVNLYSFGIPYSTPFAPLFWGDWKDIILRAPVEYLKDRPRMLQTRDSIRMKRK